MMCVVRWWIRSIAVNRSRLNDDLVRGHIILLSALQEGN